MLILIFLLQQPQRPWWVTLIAGGIGIGLGLLGALPWRSAAEAARNERDSLRETTQRLREENKELEKEKAVLKARTDLDGLRLELTTRIETMTAEFKLHSEQDNAIAQQQTSALEAVKVTLQVIQEQLKK